MLQTIDYLENQRLFLQRQLDSRKTPTERNRLGQFATPTLLAVDILKYAATLIPENEKVRLLDPAVGTGAFFSALLKVFPRERIAQTLGFEIDPHYGEPAKPLWAQSGFTIRMADFTRESPVCRFNLLICNPPYVRHHHLSSSDKTRLQLCTHQVSGMRISGLAGLYCHFLGLAHPWMTEGGIGGWLIPSEFMDVNYGKAIKHYLLEKVTLLHIHRFDPSDIQFADALVSSAVVWFRKAPPPKNHQVKFTFGGTLNEPKVSREISVDLLAHESKWSRFPQASAPRQNATTVLSDFFQIKRGLVTGDNSFFILERQEIASRNLPMEVFRPILPSPRYLPDNEIISDSNGLPLLERSIFLLDTQLPEEEIRECFPTLFAYLEEGKTCGIHQRYICRHRTPWYSQEHRPPSPIVCTYMGRGDVKNGRPFRFILNSSKATVANVYLAMYPKPRLAQALEGDSTLIGRIQDVLNRISPDQLLGQGRVYGGGLHKLEPSELGNVDVSAIAALIPDFKERSGSNQLGLFSSNTWMPSPGS
ncbi:MAG: SAM-dependent DNA methyltransferase [Gammaproteobacteria bacterium]|nr:SAM-dependent DNA methyltransferase [Gammaproteobacteria bacterium]